MTDNRSFTTRYSIWLLALLLLLAAASRIIVLRGLEMHTDEVWSIWQTFGTPQQIIDWTPYDWPPLYYLLLGGWKELVGVQPIALRMSSVLAFVVSVAVLYRIVRRLRDDHTAIITVLVYGALGYSMRMSTEVRAYVLMMTMLLLAFWMMLRYFDYPSLRRAVPLGLSMAAAFSLYLPGVIGFMVMGLYSLIVYRRAIYRWWLPGLIALVPAAPLIAAKLSAAGTLLSATDSDAPQSLLEGLAQNFAEFTVFRFIDYPVFLWVVIFLLATALIIWRWRSGGRVRWALAACIFLLPIFLYVVNPWLKFFDKHYSMALVIPIALWVGWGLGYLPRRIGMAAATFFVILMFIPFQMQYYGGYVRPFAANFEWLSQRLQPGDVLLIDPNKGVDKYYEWGYAEKVYFPNGLQFVADPGDHRRVWHITDETNRSPATAAAVKQGRIEREFVGPADFFFRLYEAPPNPMGIPFENGMRFHGYDLLAEAGNGYVYESGPLATRHEGEAVRVRLWWSVDEAPTADYSVGLYLLDGNMNMAAQADGAPQVVSLEYPPHLPPPETSRWTPGNYYVEERDLMLPYVSAARLNTYNIYLAVYQWWDNTRIAAPGVDDNQLLWLQSIYTETW